MTEREKIAQIIAEHLCPQGKAHKALYGAERMCYSRNNFADCEKVSDCVDALIVAGIGDKSGYRSFISKDGTEIKQLYSCEEVEQIANERDEYKHRAEVAERQAVILSQWLAEKTRKDYLWQVWLDAAQKQAEKELAEEGKK